MKNIKNKILQIINNKRVKRIAIVVILFALIFGFYKSLSNSNKDLILVNNRIDRRQFKIYKQKDDKNGYELYNGSGFPEDRKLNTSLTVCVDTNNNTVENIFSYEDGIFSVTSNKTVFCTLYFDVLESLAKLFTTDNTYIQEYKGTGWVGGSASEKFFNNHIYYWYATSAANANAIRNSWNVVFAGFCWQVIRTTENGGVKLLYNGEPIIGESNGETTYDCSDSRGYHMGEAAYPFTWSTASPRNFILSDSYTVSTNGTKTTFTLTNSDGSTPTAISIDSSNVSSAIGKYMCGVGSSTTCVNNDFYKIIDLDTSFNGIRYTSTHYSDIGKSDNNQYSLAYAGYMRNDVLNNHSFPQYNKEQVASFSSLTLNSTSLGYYYSDSYSLSSSCGYSNIEGENTCYTMDGTSPSLGSSIVDPTNSGTDDYSKLIGKYTVKGSSLNKTSSSVYYVVGYSGTTLYVMTMSLNHPLSYYKKVYNASQTYENGMLQNSVQVHNFMTPSELQADPTSWQNTWPLTRSSYTNYYVCTNGTDSCEAFYIHTSSISQITYSNAADIYNFSNSYSYNSSTGKYTLDMTDANATSMWNLYSYSEYNKIGKAHYVCLDSNNNVVRNTTVCSSVGYVFNKYQTRGSEDNLFAYIVLSGGRYVSTNASNDLEFRNDNNALYTMLYKDDVNNSNSSYKNDVDRWYENHLLNTSAEKLIDTEEIYCGDRTTSNNYGGWNLNASSLNTTYSFGGLAYKSVSINGNSTSVYNISCPNITDAYSKKATAKGNGALTYPVALISYPEMYNLGDNTARKSGGGTVTMSPKSYEPYYLTDIMNGFAATGAAGSGWATRPSIALKSTAEYTQGDGSFTNPYVVES